MPSQIAWLTAEMEMLTFGRGVVTSCWKEESPTAGIPTAGRGRALPDPLLAPLESRGGGKEERNSCARAHLVNRIPVLKQTAAASTMGLRWAPKCHTDPIDSKRTSCHCGLKCAQGKPALPLTKQDSSDGSLLETAGSGGGRGK